MRTRVAITENVLIGDNWYKQNEVYPFVSVTGDREKIYQIKTPNGFVFISGEYCTEVPDSLILDSRNGFQIMEDTMDKTTDYQKAYKDLLGIKGPKMLSHETGRPISDNTPIETDGRQKELPREGDTSNL